MFGIKNPKDIFKEAIWELFIEHKDELQKLLVDSGNGIIADKIIRIENKK